MKSLLISLTAIANGRNTIGPNPENDAEIVIWKDAAKGKKK